MAPAASTRRVRVVSASAAPAGSVREVTVRARRRLSRFRTLISPERFAELRAGADRARERLATVRVFNVNSTAAGGGVAEILEVLVGYSRDAGVDVRWLVLEADEAFFAITKRIHNRLHGFPGDDGDLGPRELAHYRSVLERCAVGLLHHVRPGDVVLLHDPQTAGLAAPLAAAGVVSVWRCHVGSDRANRWTAEAWAFLRPHVEAADAAVFTRRCYVPEWLADRRVAIIPPSIDPFSPKNRALPAEVVRRLLRQMLLMKATEEVPVPGAPPRLATARVSRPARVVAGSAPLEGGEPLVLQISRWDRLKDMDGVMEGFASSALPRASAQLALIGPEPAGVADDPESAEVLAQCVETWCRLPSAARQRIRLITLPMDDLSENALMVNALQRHAAVVVQKSLAEGFGLTVAEAMWKGKPVVASAVGGIVDQVTPGTGVLVDDPANLDEFGLAVASLLKQPTLMRRLGEGGRMRVLEAFLGDRHLLAFGALLEQLVG